MNLGKKYFISNVSTKEMTIYFYTLRFQIIHSRSFGKIDMENPLSIETENKKGYFKNLAPLYIVIKQ